ncbi:MAG: bifunctional tetrahydrofolate synthase/dihydrofolate synthase [Panacagrimonas sp.]
MPAPAAGASLAQWLAWQEQVHPRNIELGLDRVGAVAARMGLPDTGIASLIVAGTNGKGSSATLAALIYREAGYKVGLYTSPHLLHYNERVAIDGVDVDDALLCAAFTQIERARQEIPLTYFEYGTLAALWCFRQHGVQVQVLEVGLGGRLDAVNLVDADAALISSIGIDHTDWLGPDRDSIGLEKAHVFRARRPAVVADPMPPSTVLAHAEQIDARLQRLGPDFQVIEMDGSWCWQRGTTRLDALPLPGLQGVAQLRNAAGVIAVVQALQERLPVAEQAIRRALPKLSLRGRFQQRGRVIFDVAHNVEAAAVLADNLRARLGHEPVALVLGMLADKPVQAFCAALSTQVQRAYCASLPPPRGLPGDVIRQQAESAGMQAQAYADVASALQAAQDAAGADGWVLVTGSFLTAAAGLEFENG